MPTGGISLDLSFLSGAIASPWDIIRSLLDITIVAYVFYRILGLIRGTRAEQLLKGLVLLLVFSVLAGFLRLDMVNWLVEKLWIVFAITLPIVFQPELRRLLEQLGRGSFFASTHRGWLDREDWGNVVEEIADAVTILSRDRVGALIVIARDTGIGEYLESGVDLDSLVSASLLVNLFIPRSPLHDGAVVINHGRIEKAACFLPLSDNPTLDKSLGTRHRAGIGISEVSDALVVIVSEETGTISLAQEGTIRRYLDVANLTESLNRGMLKEGRRAAAIFRRWTDD